MNTLIWLLSLTCINAGFSIFEMSLAACRELRLKSMIAQGNKNAIKVLEARKQPTLFIGTSQLGLNVIAILSGVYVESVISEPLSTLFVTYNLLEPILALKIATIISISGITILFLLFGDLLPKRIAMLYPEKIACFIISFFSKVMFFTTPILHFLNFITEHIVTKIKPNSHNDGVTFEEVCMVIEQGVQSGAVDKTSLSIVENALNLDERNITEIMIPRTEIDYIDSSLDTNELILKLKSNPYHRYIICDGDIDNVLGLIELTDLIPIFSKEQDLNIKDLIKPMHYMPETVTIQQALNDLQKAQRTIAMIINEFGEVIGMARITDIHNAIVGKNAQQKENDWITIRADGSWFIAGDTPITIMKNAIGLTQDINGELEAKYHTVNGMIMYLLNRMPTEGDILEINNYIIEVVDIDKHIIDKILVQRKPKDW